MPLAQGAADVQRRQTGSLTAPFKCSSVEYECALAVSAWYLGANVRIRRVRIDGFCNEDVGVLQSARTDWAHGAPLRRTFSAAMNCDNGARAKKLRSAS